MLFLFLSPLVFTFSPALLMPLSLSLSISLSLFTDSIVIQLDLLPWPKHFRANLSTPIINLSFLSAVESCQGWAALCWSLICELGWMKKPFYSHGSQFSLYFLPLRSVLLVTLNDGDPEQAHLSVHLPVKSHFRGEERGWKKGKIKTKGEPIRGGVNERWEE